MSTALAHIREKLKRADEHIAQLHRESEVFLSETPHAILTDYDAESAEAFEDFHRRREVPPRLSVLTGDVIYQVRSCLDHLVCALIQNVDVRAIIEGYQPYLLPLQERPSCWLAILKRLSNRDKHRARVGRAIDGLSPYL